jgi:hypothetical protein
MTQEQLRQYMLGLLSKRESAEFEELLVASPTIALDPSVAEPDEFLRKLKRYYPNLMASESDISGDDYSPQPLNP